MIIGGSMIFQNGNLDDSRAPSWLFVMSQPLLDIRLPTYPSVTRRKPKKFGLFRIRSPLLTESLFNFSSSGYLDVSVPPVPYNKPILFSLC